MRVIVTGGAGFIGSHLADALIAAGDRVLIIDNFRTGRKENVKSALAAGAELAELDIADGNSLDRIVQSYRPDVIFHFAAHIDVSASTLMPAFDALSNVIGSINVLAAAAEHGVRKVVNASTGGAIYGSQVVIPTRETEPAQPICPYGLSKLSAESYAHWFHCSRGLDTVTLRFGNIYGERQDPAQGAVIARFCDQAIRGVPFEIFGTGDATRDYVYVADVVAATLSVARREKLNYSVYNIGGGQEISVRQLARAIAIVVGEATDAIDIKISPARHGEVLRSFLDISRAKADEIIQVLTPLEVGIEATLAWRHASGANPKG